MKPLDEQTPITVGLVVLLVFITAYIVKLEARVDRTLSLEETIQLIREDVIDIKVKLGVPLKRK